MKIYCEDCIWVKPAENVQPGKEMLFAKCGCPEAGVGPYVTRKESKEYCSVVNHFGRCRHYESEFRPRLSVWHRLFSFLHRDKQIELGSVTIRKGGNDVVE